MAHFAKLDEGGLVLEVIVVSNAVLLDENGDEQEHIGVRFLQQLYGAHTAWKQTSYTGAMRKNFAGAGYVYDETRDAFIAPRPFPSWVLDEDVCQWQSPTPRPDDGALYDWDEQRRQWVPAADR